MLGRNIRSHKTSLAFEKLEQRKLFAADLSHLFSSHLSTPHDSAGLVAEGEGPTDGGGSTTDVADDLVLFAQQLTLQEVSLFCAGWSEDCTQQKELFEDGGKFLPTVEVTNPDRTLNSIGQTNNITTLPTWVFPNGTRLEGIQTMADIAVAAEIDIPQSAEPSFNPVGNVTVQTGSPLHVPIDAYDPNGGLLTVTVEVADPDLLEATVLENNRSLELSIAGYGDMVFELFEGRAPAPSARVIELANADFYDNTIFHRIIESFVIQGGDPTGTGSGGSSLGNFDDQYHLDLQHNAEGILSYAKAQDDTNDSQFFVTDRPLRDLDYNHSVFGTLVEGFENRAAVRTVPTNTQDRPLFDVTLETASIVEDQENSVIVLKPVSTNTGSTSVTITVTDQEGNEFSEVIEVTVVADTANGGPFLNPIANTETAINHSVSFQVTSQDREGDPVSYVAAALGNTPFEVNVNSETGVIEVIPPTGFVGELPVGIGVEQITIPTTTRSRLDTQIITVTVNPSSHQNQDNQYDVNDDGSVSPIDALIIVNHLNSGGATDVRDLPAGPPLVDVSGDCAVSPIDALMVINQLNTSGGEGEADGAISSQSNGTHFAIGGALAPKLPTSNKSQSEAGSLTPKDDSNIPANQSNSESNQAIGIREAAYAWPAGTAARRVNQQTEQDVDTFFSELFRDHELAPNLDIT